MRSIITIIKKNDEELPEEDRDMVYIWEALSALVRLSIKYVDLVRSTNPSALQDIKFNLEEMKVKYL
jgi:hypothetical protein